MGAGLVALVLTRWTHLPDQQWRVLVRMAHTALDQPRDGQPAATYYGGHELLARTLRREYPPPGKARDNVLRDVRRIAAGLAAAGAIKPIDTGQPIRQGNGRTYLLTLAQIGGGVHNPSSAGVVNPSSAGDDSPSSAGDIRATQQGMTTPPRRSTDYARTRARASAPRSQPSAALRCRHKRPLPADYSGCPECEEDRSLCVVCGGPLGDALVPLGVRVHDECRRTR